MLGSPRKGSEEGLGQPISTCLLSPSSLTGSKTSLPSIEGKHPCLTNQRMSSLTSLFLFTSVYKTLSNCTTAQCSFYLLRLDAACFMNRWIKPIRSLNFFEFKDLIEFCSFNRGLIKVLSDPSLQLSPLNLRTGDMCPNSRHSNGGWRWLYRAEVKYLCEGEAGSPGLCEGSLESQQR